MRVAFFQKDPLPDPYVASLAAAVTFRGHEARAFLPAAERDLARAVRTYAPGALVFHVAGGFVDWAEGVGRRLRRELGGPPVCFVGDFATDHPELATRPDVDFVLTGDADETLSELLWRISKEKTLRGTMGTAWGTPDGRVEHGPPRDPIGPLDDTAAADVEIYRRYPFVLWQRTLALTVGRGTIENLHAGLQIGLGEVARRFRPAPRHSVAEAITRVHRAVRRRSFARRIGFRDDTLTLDADWLLEFLDRYRREIGLPFGCMARPDQLSETVLDALTAAGCDGVRLGIESGDATLRTAAAGAAISDEAVVQAVRALKARGLRVHTVSWLGLPGETVETALRTPELLARLRPDHAFCFPVWGPDRDPDAPESLQRLAWLAPFAASIPSLSGGLGRAAQRPLDRFYERLSQGQHDLAFVRSGELPPLDLAHLVARMSRRRGQSAARA